MIYYIKVTPEVAKRFCNLNLRNVTKDGNILLWMSDLNTVPGDTIADRAKYVGGALLTANEANDEYWGYTKGYTSCYTPSYYGGTTEEKAAQEGGETGKHEASSEANVGTTLPKVEATAVESGASDNEEESGNEKNKEE